MSSNYQIKTEVFEGPLELLLDLVEKRKLFVNVGRNAGQAPFCPHRMQLSG